MMKRALLALAATSAAATSATPFQANSDDIERAVTMVPRDNYKGAGHAGLSTVLNGHLKRSEELTKPCEEWSLEELQDFMSLVNNYRSPKLQEIYQSVTDRRMLIRSNTSEFQAHWQDLNRIVKKHQHLFEPLRDTHCREAVMWWTHHIVEDQRAAFRTKGVTVPLLPETEKKPCGGQHNTADEDYLCASVAQPNSCDWCHSTQARHDAGEAGTTAPNALDYTNGPDDGNPHGWDRTRRCDQDQMPRCQLCEGVGGVAIGDDPDAYIPTPCTVVATPIEAGCIDDSGTPASCNKTDIYWPLYPKSFSVLPVDGRPGYSDTLIGWKTDPFCFAFFPQNDSIPELCYRSQDSTGKWYDIAREATRTDYNVKLTGIFSVFPNITSSIMQVDWQMWIQNHLWVVDQCICANPSGQHCTNESPCKSYAWHWDTFATAQYLGRENIGVEWLQGAGVGNNSKIWQLDHFIMWSHHAWTDPKTQKIVRMWKSFNGLQNYDPEAWTMGVKDPDTIFESPPAKCKKGGAPIRINCDDDGNFDGTTVEGMEHIHALATLALKNQDFTTLEKIKLQYEQILALTSNP